MPVKTHQHSPLFVRAECLETGGAGSKFHRHTLNVPAHVHVFILMKRDAEIGPVRLFQRTHNSFFFVRIDNTVDHKAFITSWKFGLIFQDESKIFSGLTLSMTWRQVIADYPVEHKCVRFIGQ